MKKLIAILSTLLVLTVAFAGGNKQVFEPGLNRVTFESEGETMVGNLFLPETYVAGDKLPAVVVTGTWTSVKEMMANTYAQNLANEGFAAFTFDFRFWGESGGEPRQFESPVAKATDIRNATNYLASLPVIDANNLGGLAVCASAGYMAQAIAEGAPLKSFVTVAAWLHDRNSVELIYGGAEGVAQKIQAAEEALALFEQTGEVLYVPAYSTTDQAAAMVGEFDYYGNPERGAIPQWDNNFAVKSWKGWLEYEPIVYAPNIDVPTLFIHSDNAALPDGVRDFYAAVAGPKSLYWTQGAHFDFYDGSEVGIASEVAASHFRNTLQVSTIVSAR